MNTPTKIQYINDDAGKPAFVVIPYDEYVALSGAERDEPTIPHAVVCKILEDGMTPVKAWREHLGLSQQDVADRLGISQPAYAKQENSNRIKKSTKTKIAKALAIDPSLLDEE